MFGWLKGLVGKSIVDDAQSNPGWSAFGTGDVAKASTGWESYDTEDREGLARKVSLIFDCVTYCANTAAEPPMGVVEETEETEAVEFVESHPIHPLLRRPNGYYSRRLLVQFIVSRLLTTGEYYVWKWRNRYELTELWPVPSSWCGVVTGSGSNLVDHYTIRQGRGRKQDIPSSEMVRQWFPHPASTWKAFGPLHGIERDVQVEQRRQNLLGELLQNLNVPGITVTKPHDFTPTQKRELRQALMSRFGEGGRGRHLLLGGGGSVELLNPLKDLDTEGLMAATEPRICGAFGVPPILVGARIGIEHSTYANYAEARRSFYRDAMRPLWMALSDGLTKGLLQDEGEDGLRVAFDLSQIPELQQDLTEESKRATELFQGGLAMRDEARKIAGLSELGEPDGEMFLVPSSAFERRKGEEEVEL